MAMPTDFWRNDHMLNLFRTKPCQRLSRDGVCQWKSRCQFSHTTEWPRRAPRKHKYSPQLCPHVQVVDDDKAQGKVVNIRNTCTSGLACPFAHSMEEVLFHPLIFKTTLCEEQSTGGTATRHSRGAKRGKCHRYYCPFAHGAQEVRTTTLTEEQRDLCLRELEVFPSDDCCKVCCQHRVVSLCGEPEKDAYPVGFQSGAAPERPAQPVPYAGFNAGGIFRNPSTVQPDPFIVPFMPPPGLIGMPAPPQFAPPARKKLTLEAQIAQNMKGSRRQQQQQNAQAADGSAPIRAQLKDPFLMPPQKRPPDPFRMPPTSPFCASLSTSLDSSRCCTPVGSSTSSDVRDPWVSIKDMPAFIEISAEGLVSVGPR